MKKIFFFILITASVLQACDKTSPGNNYDFSNSLPPYVTISNLAERTVYQDTTLNFTFQMRTSLQQPVTVTYEVTGAINMPDQTVVIDRDKTSAVAPVTIPGNIITTPGTTVTATLKLLKAVTAAGKSLTIGRDNDPAKQMVAINITE
jgi:uncharacterized protein YcfL